MNNVWVKSANKFAIAEVSQQMEHLPVGVYKLEVDERTDTLYLSQTQDKFTMPYKVYGVERPFIDRVIKSWNNTVGNFGVLMNGTKGTGKTVTAEIICNEMNLPVIIIPFHHKNLLSFLNDIQQDVIVFIDEYEKIYDSYNNSLLPIMDGVMKTKYRIMFLLTTNEIRIERNMLQRPSRIRYIKTFGDMTLEIIMEVVNDLLEHKEHYHNTVKMISEMPIITMDLVKSIVGEVNIHNEDPYNFREIFNIHSERDDLYNVYEIENGQKEEVASYAVIRPSFIGTHSIHESFYVNGKDLGTITHVFSENQISVRDWEEDDNGKEVETTRVYTFERTYKTHKVFTGTDLAF